MPVLQSLVINSSIHNYPSIHTKDYILKTLAELGTYLRLVSVGSLSVIGIGLGNGL